LLQPTSKALLSPQALVNIDPSKLSELRALVYCNGYLYVASGGKATSNVLTFQHQSVALSYEFGYVADFVDSTQTSKGHFETSIAHPFSLAFDGAGSAYVSNQDTNVVARVALSANFQTGSLGAGCQSPYLIGLEQTLCPKQDCVFLDGTFVASQMGTLHNVKIVATDVPANYGGLAVFPTSGKLQNSVRDVAIANGMLFVCDEPSQLVRIYALPNGTYAGASAALPKKPTHLAVQDGGLYASASGGLYWSPLPASSASPSLNFQQVLTAPASNTIGGISFDQSGASATVYVCFQAGTGGAFGGSIQTFTFSQASSTTVPTFTNEAVFASSPTDFQDTPEFVLYLFDSPT
jgi:hypothetical protein